MKSHQHWVGRGLIFNLIPSFSVLMLFVASRLQDHTNGLFSLLIWGISGLARGLWGHHLSQKNGHKNQILGILPFFFPLILFWGISLLSGASLERTSFENDYYRYLFEGRAWRLGYEPYLHSPLELAEKVPFSGFFKIGHPELTGIYPPLTLIFFAGLSFFSFPSSLILLAFINSCLSLVFFRFLHREQEMKPYSFILIFFLLREMVFQLHFEIWPILAFTLALCHKNYLSRLFFYGLSFHLKFIALISFIVEVFWPQCDQTPSLKKRVFLLLSFLALSGFILWSSGIAQSDGLKAFSDKWYFAPGFLGWFYPFIHKFISFQGAKMISGGVAITLSLIIVFKKIQRASLPLHSFLLGVFFYFSPVYNAWYALWPGLAILLVLKEQEGQISKKRCETLFSWVLILSPLSYTFFISGLNWFVLVPTHFLLHLPLLIFLGKLYRLGSNHSLATQSATSQVRS